METGKSKLFSGMTPYGYMSYKEHQFPSIGKAQVKQRQMKRLYGYMPEVFKITSPQGKVWYSVVEPRDLPRIALNRKR